MPRLPDEQWAMIEDSIDKKRIAASAFKQRTHCGKGGCNLPSDFRTKKELKAMNGEVKIYRMNDPMSWDEFKEMPDDYKKLYIKGLRNKFNVPDQHIAEMFNVSLAKLTLYLKDLKLEYVHDTEIWNKEAFLAWRTGARSKLVEEVEEVEPVEETKYERKPMTREEFKKLTDSEKVAYIRWIEDTFGAPGKNIADMLGVSRTYFSHMRTALGCNTGSASGASKKNWDSAEFDAWVRGDRVIEEKTIEEIAEEVMEVIVEDLKAGVECAQEPQEPVETIVEPVEVAKPESKPVPELVPESRPEPTRAIPSIGSMTFQSPADQILNMLSMVLGNSNVKLSVQWEIVE